MSRILPVAVLVAALSANPVMAQESGMPAYGDYVAGYGVEQVAIDLAGFTDKAKVNPLPLSSFERYATRLPADTETLEQKLAANADRIAALRQAIAANPVIVERLQEEGYSPDQVIDVLPAPAGAITVVIDDLATAA